MGVGKSPTANPEDAPALLDISPCTPPRKESSCQCHPAADFAMSRETPGQANPRASSVSYSRPSRQSQTPHRVRAGDVASCTIPAFHIRQAHVVLLPKAGVWCFCEDCSPRRRKGPLPPLPLPSIQSFNPDLRDVDCGHSLDDRALQTPTKTLCCCCWFSLPRDSPRIP